MMVTRAARQVWGIIVAAGIMLVSACAAQAYQSQAYDLRDCMDNAYGIGAWTSNSDIQPAIHSCAVQIQANGGRGTFFIPAGLWHLRTPNVATDLNGNYVEGVGSQGSVIEVDFTSGVAFPWSGANGFGGGGMRGVSLRLCCNLGITGVYAIDLLGSLTYQPDQMEFDDLYITCDGNSYWWGPLTIDGSARSGAGAPVQGTRVGSINNVQLFCGYSYGAYFSNLVQWSITNMGTYVGYSSSGMDVYITGNGVSSPVSGNSTQVSAVGLIVSGTLRINNANYVSVFGNKTNGVSIDPATTAHILTQFP